MTGVCLLLGGIGLFLYGINFMSRSLEDAAGDNLRVFLGKTTSNSVLAVLVGLFVTALIQSSGATSVMCAGFVDSGIMELSSALFAMLGTNIGTTVTAQIVAFKITTIAPLILFIGMVLYLFVKNRFVKKNRRHHTGIRSFVCRHLYHGRCSRSYAAAYGAGKGVFKAF